MGFHPFKKKKEKKNGFPLLRRNFQITRAILGRRLIFFVLDIISIHDLLRCWEVVLYQQAYRDKLRTENQNYHDVGI